MSMAVTPAFVRLEMSPSGNFSLSYSPGASKVWESCAQGGCQA